MDKVVILGSGTSTGVPVIGCECAVCKSDEPKNKRTRASILIERSGKRILVDTAPELRLQITRLGINRIDALIYTHLHADHTAGFDDLRAFWFYSKADLPVYLRQHYHEELKGRFSYAFEDTGYRGATPQIYLNDFAIGRQNIAGLEVDSIDLPHGNVLSSAVRIGDFAYATDFKAFTEKQISEWRGKITTMVASGIHFGKHPSHSVIPETLKLFDELEVERGVITHLSHDVEYLRHSAELPKGRELAYDGMVIDLA